MIAAIIAAAALASPSAVDCANVTPGEWVETLARTEDKLSWRLADAVGASFEACGAELVVSDGDGGYLMVVVAHPVRRVRLGGRVKLFYDVQYGDGPDRNVWRKGSCWEDEFDDCVRQIRSHALQVHSRAY